MRHVTWQPTAAFGFSGYGASWFPLLGLRRNVLCQSFTFVHPCKSTGLPSRASYPAAITPQVSSSAFHYPCQGIDSTYAHGAALPAPVIRRYETFGPRFCLFNRLHTSYPGARLQQHLFLQEVDSTNSHATSRNWHSLMDVLLLRLVPEPYVRHFDDIRLPPHPQFICLLQNMLAKHILSGG